MKAFFSVLLIMLFSFASFSQIGQKIKGQTTTDITGTWVMSVPNGNTVTLLLLANGNAELDGDAMTWTTSNNVLQLKSAGGTIKYNFKQSGNNLTLSGGDLAQPATFIRSNGSSNAVQNTNNINSGDAALLGVWQAQGMLFTFEPDGKMYYNDKTMDYTVSGNTLTCVNTQAGVTVTYQYQINQGHLMLNYNGNTIMLQKKQGSHAVTNNTTQDTKKPGFLGSWVSTNNEHLTMMEGGRMTLEGYDLNYTYDATTITITAPAGNVVFSYTLNGNNFNVTNNGVTTYYKRAGANNNAGMVNTGNGAGGIDPTMVGRWGVMNSGGGGYNSQGTYSSGEYFILNANGTYKYYSESSRSATTDAGYGATNSNGYDEGTWSVRGNVLLTNSSQRGMQQYPFQKRNNKNGDPCIVINGTEYVSYYQKAPWR